MMKFGILIVDNDRVFAEDLRRRMLLEAVMEVRDVSSGGMEAYNKVQQAPPDVLLVSTSLSDVGAMALAQQVKMAFPSVRAIAVSVDGSVDPAWGAIGVPVISKSMGPEGVVNQLRQLVTAAPGTVPGTAPGAIPPWGMNPQSPIQQPPMQSSQQPVQPAPQMASQQQQFPPFNSQAQQQQSQPAWQPQQAQPPQFAQHQQAQAPWAMQQQPQMPPNQAQWGQQPMGGLPMGGGMPGAEPYGAPGQPGGYRTIRQTLIATHSPKGGVGKTTISKELAVLFSRADLNGKRLRVLLMDGDVKFGDVGVIFRVDSAYPNITQWAKDIEQKLKSDPSGQNIRYTEEQIKKFVHQDPHNRGIDLLLAPPNHSDALDITDKMMEVMLDNILKADCYDLIIVDTGPNTDGYTMVALEKANYVVYVTTQEYTAVNDCHMEIKTLRSVNFPMQKMKLVVNQHKNVQGLHHPDEIAHALGLELSGILPDVGSDKMKSLNNKGEALATKDGETYTQNLRKVANQILPVFQRKPAPVAKGGNRAPQEKPQKEKGGWWPFGKRK